MPNNGLAQEKDYGGYANNNILDIVERSMLLSGFSRALIVKCDQRSARSSSLTLVYVLKGAVHTTFPRNKKD